MFGDAVNPPQTVQLRHELPDGSRHIDWMLDLDPAGASRLVTFRLARRVDELPPGERMAAERIADHRRVYLEREGPLGEDRGHVVRVASGRIEAMQSLGDTWAFVILWEESAGRVRRQTLRVQPGEAGAWIVVNGETATEFVL